MWESKFCFEHPELLILLKFYRVSLSGASAVKTRELAESVLGIMLIEEKIEKQIHESSQKEIDIRRSPQTKKFKAPPQRIASKRPLLIKSTDNQAPIHSAQEGYTKVVPIRNPTRCAQNPQK